MKLENRVAVLTGAGSGIGRALAQVLARKGCHLALADIDVAGMGQTAELIAASGVRLSQHPLDVASRAEVAALPAAVSAAHGRVDILINNAGVALGGSFEQVAEADFDWLMEINFHGVVRMTRAFLPLLRASEQARIVYLSSLFGLIAPPGQAAYAASKFAVRGFANALRHELAGSRVGVTVVHPGGVATAIARSARMPAGLPAAVARKRMDIAARLLSLPADDAAATIVAGMERERERILVGRDAKLGALIERLSPVHYWRLLARLAPS